MQRCAIYVIPLLAFTSGACAQEAEATQAFDFENPTAFQCAAFFTHTLMWTTVTVTEDEDQIEVIKQSTDIITDIRNSFLGMEVRARGVDTFGGLVGDDLTQELIDLAVEFRPALAAYLADNGLDRSDELRVQNEFSDECRALLEA